MKALLLLPLLVSKLVALDVPLSWDIAPNANRLSGYVLNWGFSPTDKPFVQQVNGATNLSTTISNLVEGAVYYFEIRSIATNGLISNPSPIYPVPVPSAPTNLRISAGVDSAPYPIGPWANVTNFDFTIPAIGDQKFYRSFVRITKL